LRIGAKGQEEYPLSFLGAIAAEILNTHSRNRNKFMKLVQIIIGLLVPPLGVAMTVGIGPTFLINLLLTVLGWLPGSIHALWVISKHNEQINNEAY